MNERATIGDNSAAADGTTDLVAREVKLVDAANAWLKAKPALDTEADAAAASDFITQLKAYLKSVESWRVERKKPLDQAAAEIQTRAKDLCKRVDAAVGLLNPRLTAYLDKKRREQEEARRKAEEDARRAREEAEHKAREAAKAEGDVVTAAVEAQEAQRRAEDATAQAERAASAKANVKGNYGTRAVSLRTTYRAEIADIDKALAHYRNHPELWAVLEKLANADLRAKVALPDGAFTIIEERKAV